MSQKEPEHRKSYFLAGLAIVVAMLGIIIQVLGHVLPVGGVAYFPTDLPTPPPTQTGLIGYAVINSEIQPDGTKENTVDLSINSIGIGQLILSIPSKIELGSTDIVRLSISPDNSLAKLISISVPMQNSDSAPQPFEFTDKIDIYPIMQAELLSAGFDITSNDQREKIIFSDKPTEWIWTIKAKDEGTQLLVVQISIPAIVDGIEQPLSSPLKNIPTEIKVTKPFSRRVDDSLPYLIPSLIGLVGVMLGIYGNNQVKERERKILDLEKQIIEGASEKQKLTQEIAHLKSIPVWQIWRK